MVWQASKRYLKEFQQLVLINCRKERRPRDQLKDNATQGPHVHRVVIGISNHNFWGSIVSALDVGEARGEVFAACSQINDLDVAVGVIGEQHVFRFHVAVDH